MNTHVGVLTRQPYRHPGGKVAYCSMNTMEQDYELVVFRKNNRAYQALLKLDKGDIVEVRGNEQLDTYDGKVSRQLIVLDLAKDELPKEEVDIDNMSIEEISQMEDIPNEF